MSENITHAIDAGRKIRELELLDRVNRVEDGGVPFRVASNGTLVGLENLLTVPAATRGSVALADAASFVTYVNRFADGGSVIFADLVARKFEAVLDYHHSGSQPRWGRHRATFACAVTPDWKTWSDANGKAMTQEAFAWFLEANLPNIAEPAGATLLEVATTLEAKTEVAFRSHKRLADGQVQFRIEETIDARAGGSQQGTLEIPTSFVLVLAPFIGSEPVRLDARLRWRLKEGVVSFWFDLVRPDDVLRTAFEAITAGIRTQVKAGDAPLPVLAGHAPVVAPLAP